MKKVSKILAAVLSISMLPSMAVMAERAPVSVTYNFNDYTSGAPAGFESSSGVTAEQIDADHGTSIKIGSNTVYLLYNFPSDYAAGDVVDVSFDYYQAAAGAYDYDFIMGANGQWAGMFQISNDGNVKTYDTSVSTTAPTITTPIGFGAWHNFDINIEYHDVSGEIKSYTKWRLDDGEWQTVGYKVAGAELNINSLYFFAPGVYCDIDNVSFSATEGFKVTDCQQAYLYANEQKIVMELNDTAESCDATKITVTDTTAERPLEGVGASVSGDILTITLPEPAIEAHTYNVALAQGAISTASGELSSASYTTLETKKPIADFYDDFESYASTNYLKGANGHGFLLKDGAHSAIFTQYTGEAGNISGNATALTRSTDGWEYRVPYTVGRGRYEIEFDLAVANVASEWQARVGLFSPTEEESDTDWMQIWNSVVSSKGETPISIKHAGDTWQHYKYVFDYEQKRIELYVGDTLFMTKPIRGFDGIRITTPQNHLLGIDNFSAKFVHSLDGLSVVDGDGTQITANTWSADGAYKLKADITNSTFVPMNFVAFVAGYDAQENLIAVTSANFAITSGSGSYTADIEKLDMAGATEIRTFALDNINDINSVN